MAYMPIGPKAKAASVPVTLATDEGGIAVSGITINSEHDEDTQHVSGHTGSFVLSVRKDAAGALAAHDNDYSPLQVDANGALRVTGGGGGTEYTEDVASAADPAGGMLMARRRDALGAETTADGDNVALNANNKGELYVKHTDSVAAVAAGNVAHDSADSGNPVKIGGKANAAAPAAVTEGDRVDASFDLQGQLRVAGVTSTQYTEDAAAATDPVGTVPIMVRQDTLAVGTVTADGDNIAQRATAYGQAHVKALDTDALIGAATADVLAGETLEDATARTGISLWKRTVNKLIDIKAKLPAFGTAGTPSADVVSVQGVSGGTAVPISVASVPSHAVTNAGTFAVQAASAGDVAHDAADSGNPVKIGGKGTAAAAAAVTEGDRVQASFDLTGALRTVVTTLPDITVVEPTVYFAKISLAASGAVVAADGTHKIRVLSYVLVAAGTVNVNWEDATTDISGVMSLVANTGISASAPAGLMETTANQALNLTLSASIQVSGHLSYILV